MGNEDLKKLSETPHTDAARKISAMDRYAGEVAFGILAENLERKCAALHKEVETLRRWRECVISALVVSHIYRAEHDSRPEEAINELLSWECATALDPSVSKQARELVARARQEALGEAAKACKKLGARDDKSTDRLIGYDDCFEAICALQQHTGEVPGSDALVEGLTLACQAAIRYDDAIRSCANDPKKMASFCSAQGDDLDALYFDWITKARKALPKDRAALEDGETKP